jgi:hypothetical protein
MRRAILVLGLLLPPGAAAHEPPSPDDPSARNVNAQGGVVIWTRTVQDADGFADYRLTQRNAEGVVSDLPVRPFDNAVDADLGPGRDGRLLAVYDRCRFGACDLWQYDFKTRRERRLSAFSSRRRAESAVSVWEGRYSFLRYAITIGFHYGYRLAGVYSGKPLRRAVGRLADGTDIQDDAIAYATGTRYAPSTRTSVNVIRLSGRRAPVCRLASASKQPGAGSGFRVREPVISGPWVYWLHGEIDAALNEHTRVRRTPIPRRNCAPVGPIEESEELPPGAYSSLAADGLRFYASDGSGVVDLTGLAFDPI